MSVASNKVMGGVIRYTKNEDGLLYPTSEWGLARDVQMNDGTFLTDYVNGIRQAHIEFNADGSIVERNLRSGEVSTITFSDDGKNITTVITDKDGATISTQVVTFNDDGSIDESFTKA